MNDDWEDDSLKIDILASALRMDKSESKELVETLATRLQTILPESTTVERGGWILSGDRPVKKLLVRFDDVHLGLVKDKTRVTATTMKIVRGVVLKTTDISLDEWIKALATELSKASASNASMKKALSDFVN
jgi:hypothetical protein